MRRSSICASCLNVAEERGHRCGSAESMPLFAPGRSKDGRQTPRRVFDRMSAVRSDDQLPTDIGRLRKRAPEPAILRQCNTAGHLECRLIARDEYRFVPSRDRDHRASRFETRSRCHISRTSGRRNSNTLVGDSPPRTAGTPPVSASLRTSDCLDDLQSDHRPLSCQTGCGGFCPFCVANRPNGCSPNSRSCLT